MTKPNKHTQLNGKFLKDAKTLLDKQDYVQASEKLWGAAAQIIKAIALKRGKSLRSHESINKYIVELSKELNDKTILGYFSIANSLHQNFYEDWLAPETAVYDAMIVEKLIKNSNPWLIRTTSGLSISYRSIAATKVVQVRRMAGDR